MCNKLLSKTFRYVAFAGKKGRDKECTEKFAKTWKFRNRTQNFSNLHKEIIIIIIKYIFFIRGREASAEVRVTSYKETVPPSYFNTIQ